MTSQWNLLKSVRKPGTEKGEFLNCRGMDISMTTGNMLICDINNKRVQILDKEGKFLHSWNSVVKKSKLCPMDITRFDDQTVAMIVEGWCILCDLPDVEDPSNCDVTVKCAFGNKELAFPRSVVKDVTSPGSHVFTTDVGMHRVCSFDVTTGQLIRSHGELGTEDATNFNWPYYMSMDGRGRLVVADSHNRCLKMFDPKTLRYLGNVGKDKFACATGFTYDDTGSGYYYCCDYDLSQLMSFHSDGRFVEYIDTSLPVKGSDLNMNGDGRLVVSVFDGYFVYEKNK